jgi:hypothetical protein
MEIKMMLKEIKIKLQEITIQFKAISAFLRVAIIALTETKV